MLCVLAAMGVVFAAYYQTAGAMISIWMRSQTFAHGFLIAPVSIWLVWQKRKRLSDLDCQPSIWGFIGFGIVGMGWLLATLANAPVVAQYALVAMFAGAVWAILGNRMVWSIAFPLAYLWLAVPVGEAFIPPMIEFTANFTVHALTATGIPVYREGNFFSIPSGDWSVVEACSGLRYLIASFTLGTLYAYLTYRTLKRRLIFMAFAALVPIIANGLRAYMIVMIGHLSGMRLAVGLDHLIYGWVFFGMVMLLLFWGGAFWREDDHLASDAAHDTVASSELPRRASMTRVAFAASACMAMALFWPAYAEYLDTRLASNQYASSDIERASSEWKISDVPVSDWKPHYVGDPEQRSHSYRQAGHAVEMIIATYRNSSQAGQLTTSGNVLIKEKDPQWRIVGQETRRLLVGGQTFTLTQNQLHSPLIRLLVWRWYRVGSENTASPYWAKVLLVKNKLLGRSTEGAQIILATRYEDKVEEAIPVLRDFFEGMFPNGIKGGRNAEGH